MRFNAPPSIRHYHLPGREWSYITGWSPRVSIRANNDDENRAYLKFWRSFMIEYSSLASPGRRREASVRKQKRRKRGSRGGGGGEGRGRVYGWRRKEEKETNQNESRSSALNHAGEETRRATTQRWRMDAGLARVQICSSRVQWPPLLSCPSSRCYSYAV